MVAGRIRYGDDRFEEMVGKMDDTTDTATYTRTSASSQRATSRPPARGDRIPLSSFLAVQDLSVASDIFILSCHNSNDANAASIKPPGQIVRPPLLRPSERTNERANSGSDVADYDGERDSARVNAV